MNNNVSFVVSIVAGLSLLFSCQPEDKDNPSGGGGGDKTVHVTGITLSQSSLPLKEGETATLIATVRPDDATNKRVSWSSNNNEVATVEEGVVTAILAGQAIITATTEDGGKTATCSVTVSQNLAPSVTVDADKISAISVILKGKANLGSTVAADLRVGFQYSKSAGILPSNSTTVDAEDSDSDYNYTTGITGLEPATTYYFRSFVRQNGVDTYGETKQFQTKDIASLIHTQEASAVSAISARMNASYDLTDVQCTEKSFGFYWGTSATSLPTKVAAEGDSPIYIDLSGLNPSKPYYYQAYAILDGKELKDEVVSFTTKDVHTLLETKDASEIEPTSATMNAKLDLTDALYNNITYGFYWGGSADSQESFLAGGDIKDNVFSVAMNDLPHKTQYWYYAYVKLDEQAFSGEIKSFTTAVVPVESVTLDKEEDTIHTIGNTLTLQATVLPADATNKSVSWSSSYEAVATVDENGKVTTIGNGTATITVTTTDQGKTASCTITVAQYVTGISLDKTSLSLNEGENYTLTGTITPENAADKSLDWTSSNTAVATVDENGKVTAVSKGTATITATAKDGSGKQASCQLTVNRLVSTIELNKTSLILFTGKSETLTATVSPADANNTSVSWSCSNTTLATVSTAGTITAVAPGNVTIAATAKDGSGISAFCQVEIRQSVTGITLDKSSLSLEVGDGYTLTATVSPENAYDKTLSWTSSNIDVATVNFNGEVSAIAGGSATITATTKDGSGKQASCSVSVCPAGAVDLGLSVYWATSNLNTSSLSATTQDYGDYYAWGETETKISYSWESYKWGNGSKSTLTKYNTKGSYGTVDNKTSFKDYDYEDDAARAVLGGNWRTPTDAEWTELRENCTWTWTDNYNGTGVAGRIVTSNKSGYSEKSIFLPATGYRDDADLNEAGSDGYYWSSSLNAGLPSLAWGVGFNSDKVYGSKYFRFFGHSVRPVYEK